MALLEDVDDAIDFWLALADTQWTLGRLEESVKEKALQLIENGAAMERWGEITPPADKASERLLRDRELAIEELKTKMNTPQPPEKKISRYNLYKCPWKEGDVYAYPLNSEAAYEFGLGGEYFLFHKMGETVYHPGHIIPLVRVKLTKNGVLPKTRDEFDSLDYVQVCQCLFYQTGGMYTYGKPIDQCLKNEFGEVPEYVLELRNSSKRVIPKSLIYVGNYTDIKCPEIEYIDPCENHPGALWKSFERVIFPWYKRFNIRQ